MLRLKLILLLSFAVIFISSQAQVNQHVPWTWMSGNITPNQAANYGIRTVASVNNKISSRHWGATWTDNAGNLYIFGGWGYGPNTINPGELNDLWRYTPSTGLWTWLKGDNSIDNIGVYNTPGVSHVNNKPGGRDASFFWEDNNGDFWMFGGYGYSSSSNPGNLSDVWRYQTSTNNWTWMQGDTIANTVGTYGTMGQAQGTGQGGPGAREGGLSWKDSNGNFWLYGGLGHGANTFGVLADMWMYNPTTNQWTWKAGFDVPDVAPVFGTQNIENTISHPGSLYSANSWVDNDGFFWLYGGTVGGPNAYNNLWKFNPSNNRWTWVKGDGPDMNRPGVYGTVGVPTTTNKPGSRYGAATWTDLYGYLWMFGGSGNAATTTSGFLNDLWRYDKAANTWTWFKGDNVINKNGVYGIFMDPDTANKPGGRRYPQSWVDNAGNLWLFGGTGLGATASGILNDMWRIISPKTHTFVGSGSWANSSNWADFKVPTLPISESDIIEINGTGPCDRTGDMIISEFGMLVVRAGKTLNIINGALLSDGNVFGPGKIVFSGGLSELKSNGALTTPLTLSSKQMFLTSDVKTGNIELTGGSNIRLDNFDLDMETADLIGNRTNFIITNGTGRLKRFVNTVPKIFHVGINSTSYTPAIISNFGPSRPTGNNEIRNNPTAAGDTFAVNVTPGVLNRPSNPPMTIGAVNRTWVIQEGTVGGSDIDLTLQWNLEDQQPGFDPTRCAVAKVCPPPPGCVGGFDDAASAPASGGNPFSVTRMYITPAGTDTFIVRTNPVRFTFTGTGSWLTAANWQNSLMPTPPIKLGWEVIIDPVSGEAVYPGNLVVESGGILTVQPGKNLRITGNLIQQ